MSEKERIAGILSGDDFREEILKSHQAPGIFRTLLSLSYDKEALVCWRAIEAFGILSGQKARNDPGAVRTLAQRLLWMMREESGNNAWNAPEILGEIVRSSPDQFSDFAPIIASFHDEAIFCRGVLRASERIAEVRPDLVSPSGFLVDEYIRAADPVLCIYAIMLAARLGEKRFAEKVKELLGDERNAVIYLEGNFKKVVVGEIAAETYAELIQGE